MLRLLLTATLLAGASMFAGQPAECVWCPTYKCFSRCSAQCACVSRDYSGGTCVSIQAVPVLLEQGWRVLP